MKALLSDANLDDRDRAVELLTEAAAHDMSAILGSGHSYALGRCSSETSLGNYFSEKVSGISQYETTKALLDQAKDEQGWKAL